MYDTLEDFIEHIGVKGMKWGVRKDRRKNASSVAKTLTDAELKKRVARLNLEKQYVDLVNKKNEREQTYISKGVGLTTEILANSGKQVVTNLVTKQLTALVEKKVAG